MGHSACFEAAATQVIALQALEDRVDVSGAALEESAGISAPLYDVVDVLFQLQSRGFFRRQVCVLPCPTKTML